MPVQSGSGTETSTRQETRAGPLSSTRSRTSWPPNGSVISPPAAPDPVAGAHQPVIASVDVRASGTAPGADAKAVVTR